MSAPRTILLRAGRIDPATGDPPIIDGYVLVRGKHIASVGAGSPSVASATEVIDAGDATILPGLIDCHTHVSGFHGPVDEDVTESERIASDALHVADGLGALLRSGVTTIRDCGYPHHGVFAVRRAARSGTILAPRMFLSGRAICASGGHGASISVEVDGEDEVRRAVRIESKAGADWIKLMVTGGTATPGEAMSDVQLTSGEIGAAVDEAHRRGKLVCAHCSNREGAAIAIEAGVDSIEHGIGLDEELADLMVERGVWLATTLRCTEVEGTATADSGIPGFVREKAAEAYKEQMNSFKAALRAGVSIAAATDAAQPYLPLDGRSLVDELEVMTRLGMSTGRAVLTATRDAARLLRADNEVGTLEPNKHADLIIVAGDTGQDLSGLREPSLVMAAGRVVTDHFALSWGSLPRHG